MVYRGGVGAVDTAVEGGTVGAGMSWVVFGVQMRGFWKRCYFLATFGSHPQKAGRLVGLCVDWLVCWCAGRQVGWHSVWLVGWSTGNLIGRYAAWLAELYFDGLVGLVGLNKKKACCLVPLKMHCIGFLFSTSIMPRFTTICGLVSWIGFKLSEFKEHWQ